MKTHEKLKEKVLNFLDNIEDSYPNGYDKLSESLIKMMDDFIDEDGWVVEDIKSIRRKKIEKLYGKK